ncbi:MAG TPA: phenylalanine--tRNA ligase subunit beta, partial [Actinomycetota bacterium]|nr:phenylalanine--tRNA ligase subunit beta [Actinomycetota bacterium]
EFGQPLHAFDAALVTDRSIEVRRAKRGERMTTLDGIERELYPDDLLIADTKRALAIAGVIGGADSEVGDGTEDVILESAYFDADSVAFTARRHLLRTEASARFERGADPEIVPVAAERAVRYIAETAGGNAPQEQVDEYPKPVEHRSIRLRPERTGVVLGAGIQAEQQAAYLTALGMTVERSDGAFLVEAPTFRPDIKREEDLIEEVARIAGFERLPATLPPGRSGGLDREQRFERTLKRVLASLGIAEAWTTTFAGMHDLDGLLLPHDHPARKLVRLANPMSDQEDALRSTLLPGLLRSVARNHAAHRESIALFEIGRVFEPSAEPLPLQPAILAAALAGERRPKRWSGAARDWDFFAAKGVLEAIARAAGVGNLRLAPTSGMPFHPTRGASVLLADSPIGSLGEIHPHVCAAFDVPEGTCSFEIALAPIIAALPDREQTEALPRHPAVYLDLAIVVAEDVPAEKIAAAIDEAGKPELVGAVLFDVYRGEQVESGSKSLGYALELRVTDRTLTDEEASAVRGRIVDRLAQSFDAQLRG